MPRAIRTPRVVQQHLPERDAAQWLGVSPRTLWGLRASGKIPFVRIGRSIRYDLDDLRDFVESHKLTAMTQDHSSQNGDEL